jgi:hypothetical protein
MKHAVDELDRGRESYATRAWTEAYESLSRVDRAETLSADDLELLASRHTCLAATTIM